MIQSLKLLPALKEGDLAVILPIALVIISFLIYWFVSTSEKVRDFFYRQSHSDAASVKHITFNRVFGLLILGVVPGITCLIFLPEYSLADYGLTYRSDSAFFSVFLVVLMAYVVIPTAWVNAGKPQSLAQYPQIRSKIWTPGTVIINIATWALFLLGYEFLFRGILLFPLVDHLGIWIATAINASLYSAVHLPKGFREAAGAIPLGVILCLLTLLTGTIWVAFFVHLTMALTNSFVALKSHPDMHFRRTLR